MLTDKIFTIEKMTMNSYINAIKSEDIRIDQAVQRQYRFDKWKGEKANNLIWSVVSGLVYVPNIIIADQIIDKTENVYDTYIVDGMQRSLTLYYFKEGFFKTTNNCKNPFVRYTRKLKDKHGKYIRDKYGKIIQEETVFDMRNKAYKDFPEELKHRFNNCDISVCHFFNCTKEQVSDLVYIYNSHIGMTSSQKGLTNIPRFAEKIKEIKNDSRFLIEGTMLTESEKMNGIWERVINETAMAICHFDDWKQNSTTVFKWMNENARLEDYEKVERYFNELEICSDKLKSPEIAELFTSKNLFVWIMLYDKAVKLGVNNISFGEFLNAFVCSLKYQKVNEEDWETIDSDRYTKSKNLINRKLTYLETLMREYLDVKEEVEECSVQEDTYKEIEINDKNTDVSAEETVEKQSVIEFVKNNVYEGKNIDEDDIGYYEEDLDVLTLDVDNNSPLLEPDNHNSLVGIVAYSYKRDERLDEWFVDFFSRNNTYIKDQKENYTYMVNDFESYLNNNAA